MSTSRKLTSMAASKKRGKTATPIKAAFNAKQKQQTADDILTTPPTKKQKQQSAAAPTKPTPASAAHSQLQQQSSKLLRSSLQNPSAWQHLNDDEIRLRQFDMNMAYGPCTGMSRLGRWNRAEKLGLSPPADIKQLLEQSDMPEQVSAWHNVTRRILEETGQQKESELTLHGQIRVA